jgi:hypothetical protein
VWDKGKIMDIKFFKCAIAIGLILVIINTFGQEVKKTAAATKNIADRQHTGSKAHLDSAADFQRFKMDAERRIQGNLKKLAALKEKKPNKNRELQEKYYDKVLALERTNDDMMIRIGKSEATETKAWATFKRDFTRDMDELGRELKNVGVGSTK